MIEPPVCAPAVAAAVGATLGAAVAEAPAVAAELAPELAAGLAAGLPQAARKAAATPLIPRNALARRNARRESRPSMNSRAKTGNTPCWSMDGPRHFSEFAVSGTAVDHSHLDFAGL